jgi:hypothetical protein
MMQAQENDVVLVAGKGHEDYQIVGNRRLDYSDRVTVSASAGSGSMIRFTLSQLAAIAWRTAG